MIPRPHIAPNHELLPGRSLGKYEILRKLATGGMAELYLARARGVAGFEKTVVLKRILPHVAADETFVGMFLDEARLAATLQHPNIADVYDVGEVDGTPFFAMEYIHGQDVRSIRVATRKRDEQVPMAMALAVVHGTAAALDYAHARTGPDGQPLELVHRDVSPSNIVVSYDGAIKLLDFGIARAASHQHKTQIGTLKGKSPYMSPEQCRAQRLDRRSDLFSLGTLMFELTVGRRPFRGDTDFTIMEQIVCGDAPRPSSLVRGYPEDLEAIVLKLLARDVAARYQTGEELLHDLEAFVSRHGLWVSARQLGKYMRLLFASRIEAWERAASEGVTLGDHVAETVTSESQRQELVTPPSAFPALQRLSQEFPAVSLPSQQMAAVAPPAEDPEDPAPTQPAIPAALAPPPPPAPELTTPPAFFAPPAPELTTPPALFAPPAPELTTPPALDAYPEIRSSRRVLAMTLPVMIAIVIAGGIYAWPLMFPKQAPAAAGPTRPAASLEVEPLPAAAQAAATPPAPATADDPPATASAEPASAEPASAEPASTEPAAEPAAEPASAEPAPARRPDATKRTAPRPAKAPPRVPSAKQPGRSPREGAWDRDSPFLPPST